MVDLLVSLNRGNIQTSYYVYKFLSPWDECGSLNLVGNQAKHEHEVNDMYGFITSRQ